MRITIVILLIVIFSSCKDNNTSGLSITSNSISNTTSQNIKYAKGFSIIKHKNYKEIVVNSAWPNSKKTFRYILSKEDISIPKKDKNTSHIKLPIQRVIVMSTTNIPVLEYLNIDRLLVGFPNTDYVSSPKTRQHIDHGKVKNLNNDTNLNMELLLELNPELVIGFSVNGNNSVLNQINTFGIPVVLDGAWTEQHPLGRAEWIKFIAAFFDKDDEANTIFNNIEANYLAAKQKATSATKKPTVISGSMFEDIWSVPGGSSFVATYLQDASTNYLWKTTKTNGSLQLNFENVLQKAKHAQLWIGAGNFENKMQMAASSEKYTYFDAYTNNKIYTYTNKIGPKGGLLYYELGPLRPDLILKDIIAIAHPQLLPNYEPYFFKILN